jgi:hypothetical protein
MSPVAADGSFLVPDSDISTFLNRGCYFVGSASGSVAIDGYLLTVEDGDFGAIDPGGEFNQLVPPVVSVPDEIFVELAVGQTYTLPGDPSVNARISVYAPSGATAEPNMVLGGGNLINGEPTFPYLNQDYASYTFRWNGVEWRVS